MKSLKRLLVLFVTVAMMMTMCLPMMAKAAAGNDGIVGTSDDTGVITVKGVDQEEGKTINVYAVPIVTAKYDNNNNFTGYENLQGLKDIENPTADELADIASRVSGTVTDAQKMTLQADGSYTKEVGIGMYLVLVKGADVTVYNPAVVSVNYTNTTGDKNDIANSKIEMGTATLKKSTTPGVDKVITGATNKTQNGKGSSVNIGDKVDYKVTISPVPAYTGKHPKLNVVDTLSEGLTYNNDLVVKVGDTELVKDTDYKLTVNGQAITVNFVVDGKYTLNEYAGKAVDIIYSATLNSSAAINDNNNNDVVLNYTKDSKSEGNDGTDEEKTYTYTFDIDGSTLTDKVVTKVGEGKDVEGLGGATFGLYTEKSCAAGTEYKNKLGENGAEKVYNNIVSDSKGKLHVTGLAAGTYYLKELSAPSGYSVNTHVFEVVISAEYNNDGTLKSWDYTIDGEKVLTITHASKAVEGAGATIKNTKLSQLPSTGGMGTYIFTIVGVVIMVVAAGFLFLRRKESK